jgi:transposase
MINWAGTIGPQTRFLVQAILAERVHPERGYRSCLGILRLGKRYGDARLEAACARAFTAGARSYLWHGILRVEGLYIRQGA